MFLVCVQAATEKDANVRAYAVWVSEIMLQQVRKSARLRVSFPDCTGYETAYDWV